MMTIMIDSKKGFNWNITIGRKGTWSKQLDLITIVKEWRNECLEVEYADFIKGFFRKNA